MNPSPHKLREPGGDIPVQQNGRSVCARMVLIWIIPNPAIPEDRLTAAGIKTWRGALQARAVGPARGKFRAIIRKERFV